MRKQFKDIDIYAGIKAQDGAKWIKDNGIDSWYPSLFAWSIFNDVPLQALDYPPVCWILHC